MAGNLVTYSLESTGIGRIVLNDPNNLNAMSEAMAAEFASVIEHAAKASPGLKVLVLSGAGKAFSSGGHLEMLDKKRSLQGEQNRAEMRKFYRSFLGMLDLQCPIIASLNGSAIGAGLCLACACDIRIASDGAKFGFTFTKLGLHPGMGATYFVPRVVGASRAAELLLTARVVNAQAALEYGLVSRVVPTADLEKVVDDVAKEILTCGPEATRQLVMSLRAGSHSLESALEREAVVQSINYAGDEFAEGLKSVQEKRAAKF